jgi:hypothetical protein
MSAAPDQATQGFFQGINASEAGQLLSLAANSAQLYGLAFEILTQITQGFSGPSNQDILNAITALGQQLDQDFDALGNLIDQQIQLVLQNENAIALAQALAHSATALDHLIEVMTGPSADDVAAADNESDLGIQFFLALPAAGSDPGQASQTQPYFLPGIAKAGTVRILAIAARDGTELWTIPSDVSEVQQIIALMEGMISAIQATVNAAHTVVWGGDPFGNAAQIIVPSEDPSGRDPEPPDPIVSGYLVEDHGQLVQFFSAGPAPNQPGVVAQAKDEAEAARAAGAANELAYMGIPQYQTLVEQSWQVAITAPPPIGVHPPPIGVPPVKPPTTL